MNRAWHLMGWMIAIGLSAGGCERPEADLSAPEAPEAARAGWEEVPAAPSAVELLLSEMPGRVMAQREAVRAVSGPLPLFTTVAEPKAERRADPRRPGPPAPEGARPLPRQSGAPARPADGAAFAVRQHAPVGEVERPRELRVHFSEDVAGAVAGAVVSEVPIAVAPPIQGTWRWLDARTLSFTPSRGFGPATTYEVELFAAFRSARGEKLAEGLRWRFSVGGPQLIGTWPAAGTEGEAWPRHAPLLLAFDRAVDVDALRARLALNAAGKTWELRALTPDERAGEVALREAAERWPRAHLVALQASASLPADAEATLVMAVDGDLAGEVIQLTNFRTQTSFSRAELSCYWAPAPYVRAEFAVDALLSRRHFTADAFQVEPALQEAQIALVREVRGARQGRSILVVTGRPPQGTAALRATLRAGALDKDGVESTADLSADCALPPEAPRAWPASARQVSAEGRLALHATAPLALDVRAFPAPAEAHGALADCLERQPAKACLPPDLAPIAARRVEIAPVDGLAEIDLSANFSEGVTALLVELLGDGGAPRHVWLARAPVLLFAEQVQGAVVAFAVSAEDGRPRPGVEVSLVESAGDGRTARARRASTDAQGIARFEDVGGSALRVESGAARASLSLSPPAPWLLSPILAHRPGDELQLAGVVFPRGEARRLAIELRAPGIAAAARPAVTAPLDAQGRFQRAVRLPRQLADGAIGVRLQPLDARGRAVGSARTALVPIGRWQRAGEALALSAVSPEALPAQPLLFQLDAERERAEPLDWQVEARASALSFGDLPGFVFGDGRRPWARLPAWIAAQREGEDACRAAGQEGHLSTLFGGITAAVHSREGLPVEVVAAVRPEASPARPAQARGLAPPAARLVGLRPNRAFFRAGEWAEIDVLAVDLGGQIAPGEDVALEVWAQVAEPWLGGFRPRAKRVLAQALKTGMLPAQVRFQIGERALYRVIARVRDDQGRAAMSEVALWAQGARALPVAAPSPRAVSVGAELFFEPGAGGPGAGEILVRVQRPPPAAWLLLESAGGDLFTRPLHFRAPARASGPAAEDGVQSLCLRLSELGLPWERGASPVAATLIAFDGARFVRSERHLFAGIERQPSEGDLLAIQRGPSARRSAARVVRDGAPLAVDVRALASAPDSFQIEVRDALGAPVEGADLLVTLFDAGREAGEDLSAPELADRAPADLPGFALASHLPFPASAPAAAEICAAPSAGAPDRIYEGEAYRLRSPRPWPARSSAVEQRWLRTDRDGRARFGRGPDSAASSRLHVSAFDGKLGRQGQARLALDPRARVGISLDLPPFVRPGDRPVARFALDNPLARDVPLRLDLRSAGADLPPREDSSALTLPPHARAELAVPLRLEADAGSVALSAQLRALGQVRNLSGRAEVIAELSEELYSGPLPEGAHAIELAFARGHRAKRGALEVEVSAEEYLALQEAWTAIAEGALGAGDAEARLAYLFALGSLGRDGLALVAPEAGAREAIWQRAALELRQLAAAQTPGGDFSWAAEGAAPGPFLALFALDALLRLEGWAPAPLRGQIGAIASAAKPWLAGLGTPGRETSESAGAIAAYALHLRHRLEGGLDAGALEVARGLAERLSNGHAGEPLAWLLPALSALPEFEALARRFEERMISDGHGMHCASAYRGGGRALLHAEHRADGVAIDALWRLNRAPRLRDRLLRGLLSHRAAGQPWDSLQENAWAVAAIAPRLRAPSPAASGRVRAWFDGYLGEQRLSRARPVARWRFPLEMLPANADKRALVLDSAGDLRLAYRIVRRWNDPREDLLSEGTSLGRALSPEGRAPLERDVRAGVLLKAGQRLRATSALHLTACARDLVLRSPLPGGLAALPEGLDLQVRDCLGRPARVRVRRAREATEFHIDEAGAGEQVIGELWLATHRGEFTAPPNSLRVGRERRAVGGSARIRVE